MITFIATWDHNYGLGVAIINADSEKEAHKICKKSSMIWDGYNIKPITEYKDKLTILE